MNIDPEVEQKFLLRLRRTDAGCLVWTGGLDRWGHGRLHLGPQSSPQTIGAHRYALLRTGADLRGGLLALHTCDEPSCCERAHLYAGTHAQNMDDRRKRERHASKITASQADEIRSSAAPASALAEEYGVCADHVRSIKAGRRRAGHYVGR